MNPSTISIRVDANTSGAVAGLEKVERGINKVGQALATGFGIDIAGRITSFLTQIPQLLEGAVKQGVSFNETLENARLGIAAVLKQFQPEKFRNFNDALKESDAALESLKKKAVESPASFRSLVAAFQAITGPASSANIELSKQVELVVAMSQALAGLGIRDEQIIQETRALLTGNINQDAAAAKILQITSADIARAREAGQLYEFLTGKISAFMEAGGLATENYTNRLSALGDQWEQTAAELTKPIFETLKQNFLSLLLEIQKPEFKQSLETIAANIEKIIKASFGLVQFAAKNASLLSEVLQGLAIAIAGAAAAFAAMQAKALVTSPLTAYGVILWGLVTAIRAGAEGWKLWKAKQQEALSKEKVVPLNDSLATTLERVIKERLEGGTLAPEKASELFERVTDGRLFTHKHDDAEWGFKLLSSVSDELLGRNVKQPETPVAAAPLPTPKISDAEAKLIAIKEQAALKIAQAQNAIEETQNEISYKNRLVSLEQFFAKKRELAQRNAEDEANALNNQLDLAAKLVEQSKDDPDKLNQAKADYENLVSDIITLRLKQRDEMQKIDAEETEERKARNAETLQNQLAVQERELQNRLQELSRRRAFVESDFTKTDVEKRPLIISLLKEELAVYEAQVLALEKKLAAATSPEERELIQQRLDSLRDQRNQAGIGLAQAQGTPAPNSLLQQFASTFTELENRMGTFAQNMAQTFSSTFESAISSISNGITGLIMKTMTWREALLNVATTIVTTLVQSLVTYAVRWIATQILMATVGKSIQAAALAANAGLATAQSAIWAVPATLATISSYGAAAAQAPALIALAEGITLAQSLAGFRQGGYTGDGAENEPAGIVHKGEYVIPRNKVSEFGLNFFERIHSGAINARNWANSVAIHPPITSDPNVASMLPGMRSQTGSGQTPPVTIQGHSVKYAFVGITETDLKRHIEEELPNQVIKIVRGMKGELGAT